MTGDDGAVDDGPAARLRGLHRRRLGIHGRRPLLGGGLFALAGYASAAHAVAWIPPSVPGGDVQFLGLFVGGWLVLVGALVVGAPVTTPVAAALGAALGLASIPMTGGAGLLVPVLAVAGWAACTRWWRRGPPLVAPGGTAALLAAAVTAAVAAAVAVPSLGFRGLHVAVAVGAGALVAVHLASRYRRPGDDD